MILLHIILFPKEFSAESCIKQKKKKIIEAQHFLK